MATPFGRPVGTRRVHYVRQSVRAAPIVQGLDALRGDDRRVRRQIEERHSVRHAGGIALAPKDETDARVFDHEVEPVAGICGIEWNVRAARL